MTKTGGRVAKTSTKPAAQTVAAFLKGINDAKTRQECRTVLDLMKRATGEKPTMWGPTMVGFGRYHYKYESGQEGECFVTGFSPRKANLTLYLMSGFEKFGGLMKKLGKHKTGKSCLYVKDLEDLDLAVLEELVSKSAGQMKTGDSAARAR